MANYDIWIWVGVIVISLVVEFVSMDVTSVWFAIAGLIALILASIAVSLEIQIIVFIAISAILILTLRSWAKNKLLNSKETTNLELIKEEKFKLLSNISENKKGTLKYNGVIWNAISADDTEIKEGEWVTVLEIKGNKLIVKRENVK